MPVGGIHPKLPALHTTAERVIGAILCSITRACIPIAAIAAVASIGAARGCRSRHRVGIDGSVVAFNGGDFEQALGD